MNKILIVDDEPLNLDILVNTLKDQYDIVALKSPKEALNLTKKEAFDLILLDIMMPEYNGYDICKQLKQREINSDIPVIFISALSTVDDRLMAYEAGGEDYITKPIDPNELKSKVEIALKHQTNIKQLHDTIENVTSRVKSIRLIADETQLMTNFFKKLLQVETFEELSRLTLSIFEQFKLNVTFSIFLPERKPVYLSTKGRVSPIELATIEKAKNKNETIHYKSISVFNTDFITLVCNSMPINDKKYYEQLLEKITTLIDAINISFKSLLRSKQSRQSLVEKNKQLTDTFSKTESIINMIETMLKKNDETISRITNELIDSVHQDFMFLGLSEPQETEIIKLIEDNERKIQEVLSKNSELDSKIAMAKALLSL
ncbi:MAG: response regulator [Gammaproteobacteria bacterium]|nr:response regulator [Gammaproteobacteria bacterium]